MSRWTSPWSSPYPCHRKGSRERTPEQHTSHSMATKPMSPGVRSLCQEPGTHTPVPRFLMSLSSVFLACLVVIPRFIHPTNQSSKTQFWGHLPCKDVRVKIPAVSSSADVPRPLLMQWEVTALPGRQGTRSALEHGQHEAQTGTQARSAQVPRLRL